MRARRTLGRSYDHVESPPQACVFKLPNLYLWRVDEHETFMILSDPIASSLDTTFSTTEIILREVDTDNLPRSPIARLSTSLARVRSANVTSVCGIRRCSSAQVGPSLQSFSWTTAFNTVFSLYPLDVWRLYCHRVIRYISDHLAQTFRGFRVDIG